MRRQFRDGLVVEEGVACYQDQLAIVGRADQLQRFGDAGAERLPDQDVLAGEKRVAGDRKMTVDGSGDDDSFDIAGQERGVVGVRAQPAVLAADVVEPVLALIGDTEQLGVGHRGEVADQLRAPVAAADDAHPGHRELDVALSTQV
jgi:hypothetical protein